VAYDVDVHGATAKVRRPFAVFFFTTITLGVYGAVWYYRVNRELRDYGAAYGDTELADSKPRNSLLAITLGALVIVPFFVSVFGFVGRCRRVERIGGGRLTSGWLVAILAFVGSFLLLPGFAILAYVQSDLNQLWARYTQPQPEPEKPTRRARLWVWLNKGEARPLRPPPGWIFRPWAGWALLGLTIGVALTPLWPLVFVIVIVMALWVYEDCRAQGFSAFWFPTFAVNLGPPVFIAYVASRSENLASQSAEAPTPEQFQERGHLPPAGWYPDPLGEAGTRYWDGARWTQQVKDTKEIQQSLPAAGWYPDPHGAGSRYWDGAQWTDEVRGAQALPARTAGLREPERPNPSGPLPAAGWYPDPLGEVEARYWDGTQWTQDVRS
jgi:hypothetical protein